MDAVGIFCCANWRGVVIGESEFPKKSSGRLFLLMRGTVPLEKIVQATKFDVGYLASIKAGCRVSEETTVRQIQSRGYDLKRQEVSRLVLGLRLYELGLPHRAVRSHRSDAPGSRGDTPPGTPAYLCPMVVASLPGVLDLAAVVQAGSRA